MTIQDAKSNKLLCKQHKPTNHPAVADEAPGLLETIMVVDDIPLEAGAEAESTTTIMPTTIEEEIAVISLEIRILLRQPAIPGVVGEIKLTRGKELTIVVANHRRM